jgi:hypothetical protein
MHFFKQQQAEKVSIEQTDSCRLVYSFNISQKETVNQWLTDQELKGKWSEVIE